MNSDLITIALGFMEGFALIVSPCILSILPIILASTLTGSKKRPLGIMVGFAFTFAFFGYFAHQLVQYSGIDLNLIRNSAYTLLMLFAIVMLSSYLTEQFSKITQHLADWGAQYSSALSGNHGFLSGLLLGSLVSIIWTPCAGPILATVLTQIVIQKTNVASFLILLAFALGAVIPMFIISIYGLKLKNTFLFFKKHAVLFRKALGLIIILNMIYIIGLEKGYITSSVTLEATPIRTARYLEHALWKPYQAPKMEGIEAWINSPPLRWDDLKGKVVLIDFWTYSCINCVRTLPYLKYWYQKYHDMGLVIIGIHTPEFDFEKNLANVEGAVKNHEIAYPVALDNQFMTWNNFSNHYWPAQYLINQKGQVVYEHFGEGNDDVIEHNIRFLLNMGIDSQQPELPVQHQSYFITPETYLGYARAEKLASPTLIHDQTALYHVPTELSANAWALDGKWNVSATKITSEQADASLRINFQARNVYVVMGTRSTTPIQVKVLLNGKPLLSHQGTDVSKGRILVNKDSIYNVIKLPKSDHGILEIIPNQAGLEVYTFTFGD